MKIKRCHYCKNEISKRYKICPYCKEQAHSFLDVFLDKKVQVTFCLSVNVFCFFALYKLQAPLLLVGFIALMSASNFMIGRSLLLKQIRKELMDKEKKILEKKSMIRRVK